MNNENNPSSAKAQTTAQSRREPPTIDAKVVSSAVHPAQISAERTPPENVQAPPNGAKSEKIIAGAQPALAAPAPAAKTGAPLVAEKPRSSVAFAVLAGAGVALMGSISLHLMDDSSVKITQLQSQLSGQAQQIAELKGNLQSGLGNLQTRITLLGNKPNPEISSIETTASQSALTTLGSRVDELDKALPAITADLAVQKAQIGKISSTPNAAAVAVVAQGVVRAIEQSQPFPVELKALQELHVNAESLAPLVAVAPTGATSPHQLALGFAPILQKMASTANAQPAATDMMGWLASKAASLVKIRQIGAEEGTSPTAIGSRIEASLQAGNTKDALDLWNGLPPSSKALGADWAVGLQARHLAQQAARDLLNCTIASLAAGDAPASLDAKP